MLWTDDVKDTMDYYTTRLGFTHGNNLENWAWGCVILDNVEIMFARPNEHMPYNGPQFTGTLYINTDNVDAWWEKLKDKVEVVYDIENFDHGMREFAIRDCNGYILQFGQPL
jgi:uncharacterized glyoxalase superfamily protein PhnB